MDEVFAGYGKITILHNISLEIPKGNIVAVIGNSGAGKSTAIRAITAQIQPKKGKIITAGYDVKETVLVQASIGYVPQLEYQSLYYNFSAEKNALFFGRNFGLSDKQIKKRCEELLGLLGLSEKEFKKVPVKRLSGGEKKRVSIMVGLINNPEILVLDEPTTGLDPHLRIEVLNFLYQINEKFHTTILLVSHDLECVDYCNKVICFSNGILVDRGTPRLMIETLPNSGESWEIKLKDITLEQEEQFSKIKEIKYLLHIGRNQYLFYINSKDDKSIIQSEIQKLGLKIERDKMIHSTFLEYFRVQSKYYYEKKAKEIKAKIGSK
ncbi:MAG: ABC transporter ATP-binding protein [Promethearchaeota archaeon]